MAAVVLRPSFALPSSRLQQCQLVRFSLYEIFAAAVKVIQLFCCCPLFVISKVVLSVVADLLYSQPFNSAAPVVAVVMPFALTYGPPPQKITVSGDLYLCLAARSSERQ